MQKNSAAIIIPIMPKSPIFIIKASGQKERFQRHKLKKSLERTHASPELIQTVLDHIKKNLQDGITTHDIYHTAFSLLKNHPETAKRYSLKRTLMNLGPDGHTFEKFIGHLFTKMGYPTKTNQIIQGHCVTHEVDVITTTPTETLFIECKFHNLPGTKSDVKTALYVYSRGEDIKDYLKLTNPNSITNPRVGLITNTSLTEDAIKYGLCKNMYLLAWNFPPHEGLETLITRYNLYPG